ncbi:hypothetical protein V7161_30455, partial [Neobacillus drentensis]|uniref:hypothetical protein n=1 Tax=Neobacillus drentensis TaxID=220684 RepID=UPI003001BAEE
MFYIECRDVFDEQIQGIHILDCLNSVDTPRTLNDLRLGAILYPLCKNTDVVSFQEALKKYKKSLTEILSKMMAIAKSEMDLKEGD